MPKFRKKPVVVEAEYFATWNGEGDPDDVYRKFVASLAEWCGGHWSPDSNPDGTDEMHFIIIPTLEGKMLASPGDWIIKGVNDEFYPCKSDIFEKTYEPVEDTDEQA